MRSHSKMEPVTWHGDLLSCGSDGTVESQWTLAICSDFAKDHELQSLAESAEWEIVLDVLGGTVPVSVERAVAVVHCTWFCDFAACFVDNLAAMFHRKWCWSIHRIIGNGHGVIGMNSKVAFPMGRMGQRAVSAKALSFEDYCNRFGKAWRRSSEQWARW